jgi:hypothetical protein
MNDIYLLLSDRLCLFFTYYLRIIRYLPTIYSVLEPLFSISIITRASDNADRDLHLSNRLHPFSTYNLRIYSYLSTYHLLCPCLIFLIWIRLVMI